MARPALPPILLGELRQAGIGIGVRCPICNASSDMSAAEIDLPDDADMDRLSRALRCLRCGRKGGISAYPEPARWVRHLRKTGQRDRLPWFTPKIGDDGD